MRRRLGRRVGSTTRPMVSTLRTTKPTVKFFFTPESYGRYLRTPYFRRIVKKMFPNGRKGRCVVCNRQNRFLYPHHRGYECIGKERIGIDLIKVCAECNYELTFQPNGIKTKPTRAAYLAREKYLRARNRSLSYRLGKQKPGEWINKAVPAIGKVIKTLW